MEQNTRLLTDEEICKAIAQGEGVSDYRGVITDGDRGICVAQDAKSYEAGKADAVKEIDELKALVAYKDATVKVTQQTLAVVVVDSVRQLTDLKAQLAKAETRLQAQTEYIADLETKVKNAT
jgi:hypothetical protein